MNLNELWKFYEADKRIRDLNWENCSAVVKDAKQPDDQVGMKAISRSRRN